MSRDRKRSILDEARHAAQALVEREAVHVGRMAAYVRVAQMVGASEIWIRRFVNGYPEATPDLVVGFNILQAYQRTITKRDLAEADAPIEGMATDADLPETLEE